MRTVEITVAGLPGPQGSKRAVGYRRGKRGRPVTVMVESSKKVAPWRRCVEAAAGAVAQWHGEMDGPLRVEILFVLPRPKRIPLAYLGRPIATPDLSKLVRSTEDALTTSGIIRDDARIVELVAGKSYRGLQHPGAYIRISEIGPE